MTFPSSLVVLGCAVSAERVELCVKLCGAGFGTHSSTPHNSEVAVSLTMSFQTFSSLKCDGVEDAACSDLPTTVQRCISSLFPRPAWWRSAGCLVCEDSLKVPFGCVCDSGASHCTFPHGSQVPLSPQGCVIRGVCHSTGVCLPKGV